MSKQTVSENAGASVRKAADAMAKVRQSLKLSKNTTKKKGMKEAIRISANLLKEGGVVGLRVLEYLTRALNVVLVDNLVISKMEKGFSKWPNISEKPTGKDKNGKPKKAGLGRKVASKSAKFSRDHSWLASYIAYYAIMAGVIFGGKVGLDYAMDNQDSDKPNTEFVIDNSNDADNDAVTLVAEPGTYGEYLSRMQPMTPYLYALLIGGEGEKRDENGLHKPYLDSKRKWTIGTGNTILKDGSKVTKNTPHMTDEEVYDLSVWHIEEKETYWLMWIYDVMHDKFNVDDLNTAFSVADVIYNSGSNLFEDKNDTNHKQRMTLLRQDFKKYGYAMPESLVRQRFEEYPVRKPNSFGEALLNGKSAKDVGDSLANFLGGGNGIQWRRWLEAGILSGELQPDMLFDCPVHGLPEFYKYMGKKYKTSRAAFIVTDKKGNRSINRKTYKDFKEWLKAPVNKAGQSLAGWKKIRDVLPPDVIAQCNSGKCKLGDGKNLVIRSAVTPQVEKRTYNLGYEAEYNAAVQLFKNQQYEQAAASFERLVSENPLNASLHNDLAATYNKLCRYDEAIEHAHKILNEICDKKQYAAAYYNLGVAREGQGNLQSALANYNHALENGNRGVKKDITRVTQKINESNAPQKSKSTSGRKKKNKAVAFASGAKKLGNNAHSAGLDYGAIVNRGNSKA